MRFVSEDILHFEDKLYLFANNMNMLYSIEVETGELELLGSIPTKSLLSRRLVSAITEWKRCIYLIPLVSGNIWIYSIDKKKWEEIKINSYKDNWANSYFKNVVIYNDVLYLFGGYYPAIVSADLSTRIVKYDFDVFKGRNKEKRDLYFRGAPVQVDENVYLASAFDNSVLKYSLIDSTYEWMDVGKNGDSFSGIDWDGKSFWLAPRRNGIDVIEMTGTKEKRYPLPKELKADNCLYIGLCKCDEKYVIPAGIGDNGTVLFDLNGRFEITDKYYSLYRKKDDEILIQDRNGDITFIDKKGITKEFSGEVSSNKFAEMISKLPQLSKIQMNEIMSENEYIGLGEWLTLLGIEEA